jgi:hypothetical protein
VWGEGRTTRGKNNKSRAHRGGGIMHGANAGAFIMQTVYASVSPIYRRRHVCQRTGREPRSRDPAPPPAPLSLPQPTASSRRGIPLPPAVPTPRASSRLSSQAGPSSPAALTPGCSSRAPRSRILPSPFDSPAF